MRALSYIGAEKITSPPKPDRQTTRRKDISVYRVASQLKIFCDEITWHPCLGRGVAVSEAVALQVSGSDSTPLWSRLALIVGDCLQICAEDMFI